MAIFVCVYIYDILLFSKDAEEHQRHLDLVHEPLRRHQLFPCIDKSMFFQSRVPFCRYIIDKDGVHKDPEKIKVIRGWPPPTTVHEFRQYIGFWGIDQQFVEGFQAVVAPLTAIVTADFEWHWTRSSKMPFRTSCAVHCSWSGVEIGPYCFDSDLFEACVILILDVLFLEMAVSSLNSPGPSSLVRHSRSSA